MKLQRRQKFWGKHNPKAGAYIFRGGGGNLIKEKWDRICIASVGKRRHI